MKWTVIDSEEQSAEEHMLNDANLLQGLVDGQAPVLRFYSWSSPSITYGHFLNPNQYFSGEVLEKEGIQVAKRPTGGGIIFHFNDFPFSLIVPATHPAYTTNTLKNYFWVNQKVSLAIQQFLKGKMLPELLENDINVYAQGSERFCMAKPTIYDVMLEGRKIYGGAQRRTRKGFLHQGTISLASLPESLLNKLLFNHPTIQAAMLSSGGSLLGSKPTSKELAETRHQLKCLLASSFASF